MLPRIFTSITAVCYKHVLMKRLNVAMIGYQIHGQGPQQCLAAGGPVFSTLPFEPVMKVICGRDEAGVERGRRDSAGRNTRPTGKRSSHARTLTSWTSARPATRTCPSPSPRPKREEGRLLREAAGQHARRRPSGCSTPFEANGVHTHALPQLPPRARRGARQADDRRRADRARSITIAAHTCRTGSLTRNSRASGVWRRPGPGPARSATSRLTSVDLARYLVGEITEVAGLLKTFITERPLPGGADDEGPGGRGRRGARRS